MFSWNISDNIYKEFHARDNKYLHALAARIGASVYFQTRIACKNRQQMREQSMQFLKLNRRPRIPGENTRGGTPLGRAQDGRTQRSDSSQVPSPSPSPRSVSRLSSLHGSRSIQGPNRVEGATKGRLKSRRLSPTRRRPSRAGIVLAAVQGGAGGVGWGGGGRLGEMRK